LKLKKSNHFNTRFGLLFFRKLEATHAQLCALNELYDEHFSHRTSVEQECSTYRNPKDKRLRCDHATVTDWSDL
jgi:hypothetical protein